MLQFLQREVGRHNQRLPAPVAAVNHIVDLFQTVFGATLHSKIVNDEQGEAAKAGNIFVPDRKAGGTAEKLLERANDAHDRHKAKKTAKPVSYTHLDVDASFNDALDYIRSVCFENLGLVEVFFTSRITFREANEMCIRDSFPIYSGRAIRVVT